VRASSGATAATAEITPAAVAIPSMPWMSFAYDHERQRRESLMRVKEVAHELGQHPATIYRKVHDARRRPYASVQAAPRFASTPLSWPHGSKLAI
jgi:hypothetical protein